MTHRFSGIYPVMLTPFDAKNQIDWEGYAALIEWYLAHGAQGLFAVCQSSEMQFLTLDEKIALARFTVDQVRGRVPVVASGHVSDSADDQAAELQAVAGCGIDALVFVTNRFAAQDAQEGTLVAALEAMMTRLPSDLPFGLYECPAPYRRLLTDDELTWCAQSGRFAFLKDVACDLEVVKRRLALVEGTPLAINNANAATAWPVLQAGGHGFSGVMNNFHPDLYRWLADEGQSHPDLAAEVDEFLVLAALGEAFGYPKMAKRFHVRRGTFANEASRAVPYDLDERHWALDPILDQIEQGAARLRSRIQSLAAAA